MASQSEQEILRQEEDAELEEFLQQFERNGGKVVADNCLHLDEEDGPLSPEREDLKNCCEVGQTNSCEVFPCTTGCDEAHERCGGGTRSPDSYELLDRVSDIPSIVDVISTTPATARIEFDVHSNHEVIIEGIREHFAPSQGSIEEGFVPVYPEESLEAAGDDLNLPGHSRAAESRYDLDSTNSLLDTDWLPHSSDSEDSPCDSVQLHDALQCTDRPPDDETVMHKVSRKRFAQPMDHFDVKNKMRREQGLAYSGWRKNSKDERAKRGHGREARQMGPPCESQLLCKKSKKRSCEKVGEETRTTLFHTFWTKMNWDQRKVYVSSLVKRIPTERSRTSDINSRRGATLQYSLKVGAQTIPVCKKMFLSTFGLREFSVLSWTKKDVSGMQENNRSVRIKQAEAARTRASTSAKAQFLQSFLKDDLKKLPSHYCRKSTSKIYIEPVFGSDTLTAVYTEYKTRCVESGVEHVSRFTFNRQAKLMNIGFQLPKKDKCDFCCAHEAGNVPEEEYQAHQAATRIAREEKDKDKKRSINGEITMLTQDLMAVKVCPFLTASAMYYKTKLCIHNYSIFDGATKDCHCYWFDETQCDLSADTFASLMVDYLLRTNDFSKDIVLWSDNCTYQNKCATMSNALLILCCAKSVTIYQKYLQRGHTQMEVDSVHAAIERRLTNRKIFLPSDYVRFTEEARKIVPPYSASLVQYNAIKKFSQKKFMVYQSIRPGRQRKGDPTVNDIKEIRYTPDGKIAVKTSFNVQYEDLQQRRSLKTVPKLEDIPQLRVEPIKLNSRKFEDLQSLLSVVPKDCHPFYNNLPH